MKKKTYVDLVGQLEESRFITELGLQPSGLLTGQSENGTRNTRTNRGGPCLDKWSVIRELVQDDTTRIESMRVISTLLI